MQQYERKKIVICGATGNQGGAVARALLQTSKWSVTALTRDPASEQARLLATAGAEVVKADLLDVSSLRRAFTGAYGIFGLTQPWSYEKGLFDQQAETRQAKNVIWACREADVPVVLFSTLINFEEQRSGVAWIDNKLELEKLYRSLLPQSIIVRPALYMENIFQDLIRLRGSKITGRFGGDVQIPYVALQDLGKVCARIFERPLLFRKRTQHLVSHMISGKDIEAILNGSSNACGYHYDGINPLWLRLFKPQLYKMRKFFEYQASIIQSAPNHPDDLFFLPVVPVNKARFITKRAGLL